MENYLVCGNPSCRMVLDLHEVRRPQQVAQSLFNECPECGSNWATTCPHCTQPVSVIWHGYHAACAHCHRRFHAPAAA